MADILFISSLKKRRRRRRRGKKRTNNNNNNRTVAIATYLPTRAPIYLLYISIVRLERENNMSSRSV
jgi:hypothetical protein